LPPAFNLFWGEKNSGRESGAAGRGRFGLLLRRVVKKNKNKIFAAGVQSFFWGRKIPGGKAAQPAGEGSAFCCVGL